MSLVLLIALLVLALKPTLVTISSLLGQIDQQKAVSAKLDKKITLVQQAIVEMDSVTDKIPLLDSALPKDPNWEELSDSLYEIATNSGLVTTDIMIDKIPISATEPISAAGTVYKPLVPSGVIPVRFTLVMSGDYSKMRQVVADLESMRRVLMLSEVDIVANKNGVLTMTITGEAGYMPDKTL